MLCNNILVVFSILAVGRCEKASVIRQIKKNVIPVSCNLTSYEVVHITATNTANKIDVIHYLITTIKMPTIVIKHVLHNTTLTLNKDNICKQSGVAFVFSPDENKDMSGMMITKVFAYADEKDSVSLLDAKVFGNNILPFFSWNFDKNTKDMSRSCFHGEFKPIAVNKIGHMDFNIITHDHPGHSQSLPHNPIHANISEFTLSLKDLPTSDLKNTRYAVEITFFTTHNDKESAKYSTIKSIDDEYTPGIFKIWAVSFPLLSKEIFASWKPVAYNSLSRSRETQSLLYSFKHKSKLGLDGKLSEVDMKVWNLVKDVPNVQFYPMNLTFGLNKDGFYKDTHYMSWTGMIGYDRPPFDSISQTVIIVMSVGLGAPVVAILAAVFVGLIRRVRFTKRHDYQEIN